jgi:hypothetical protein
MTGSFSRRGMTKESAWKGKDPATLCHVGYGKDSGRPPAILYEHNEIASISTMHRIFSMSVAFRTSSREDTKLDEIFYFVASC